ncbi:MAG: hypothetical protein JKY53_08100 [Flavobacteriales bacterium]|nr:hypothetical protein [Flavobacteriales bacterium]
MSQHKSNNQRYLFTISIVSALMLVLINAVLILKFPDTTLRVIINGLLVLFYVSSIISGFTVIKSNEKRPQDIVRASMASTTFKLLGYLLVLGIIVYTNKPIAKEIVGFFFVQYFVFTMTEKVFILKFIKR